MRGQPGRPRWGRRREEGAAEAGLCEVPRAGGQQLGAGVCVCATSKEPLMWAGPPDAHTTRPRSLHTEQSHVSGRPFFLFQPTPGSGSSLSQRRPHTHLGWSPAPAALRIWLCSHPCCSLCFILNPHVGKRCRDTAYWTCFLKMR